MAKEAHTKCRKPCMTKFDGTPCAVKAARTVWSRGKVGDHIKDLPMAIRCQVSGHEAADGWRRRGTDRHDSGAAAFWTFRVNDGILKQRRTEFDTTGKINENQ